jgi:hypothetical protein
MMANPGSRLAKGEGVFVSMARRETAEHSASEQSDQSERETSSDYLLGDLKGRTHPDSNAADGAGAH